ncbi:hypothetical protein DCAR_0832867 [Daucus carota subsp. sativus]|uniref:VQ domain-containing protein n=1 Tax=Daucus carota subsp. sativus TaxID=79200 RepID=A0A175YRQ8_DAUCS|nr:PREDICTED: VQ motif-containing protein 8, chloroplastic [Daucus carota subsp. sativus]WOH13357.1 hypothetical protein DCAR_0832867 [Daucus carota subsp. sativus]
MSPLSNDLDRPERVINGPRPSPLKINKHSNAIQKPPHHHRKLPVIIYVHSPKIIHTKPSDFMALVQKLTGSIQRNENALNDQNSNSNKNLIVGAIYNEKEESSSGVADEMNDANGDVKEASSTVPPANRNRDFLNDFPLYTPNYYPGDHVLRYSDMVFQSPNMGNMLTLSPSFLEVMKDLPQY